MIEVKCIDLGLIDYKEAWDIQEHFFNKIIEEKLENRNLNRATNYPTNNFLLLCEHPHVYTLGKSGNENNLLINEDFLKSKNASFYKINRGGDITYHGPGQLVVYPIFNLDNFFTDIHKFLRFLEEAVILTLEEYGIKAGRLNGLTGVWLEAESNLKARKICAMGVKCSRWVTMHGIGFNVNTNLDYFNFIVPCGITDKKVTSMQKELNSMLNMQEVKDKLIVNLANIFGFNFVQTKNEYIKNV